MGDLNLNNLRPGDKEGKILCDLEEVYVLECLIKEPARITENSSTLLDVILTNKQELFRASGVYNPEISDHHIVYALLKERAVQHGNRILKVRSYKNFDAEKFKEDLKMAPLQVGEIFESVDNQYEYWEALLNTIVDDHVPTRDMRVRTHNVPYMTREWKNAIKAKRRFSKKFSKNPTSENFEMKRKWRNEATKQKRIAIRQYWKKVSDNVGSDPRKFYKTFRSFTDLKNKQGSCSSNYNICLKVNDELEENQTKVASHFARFFSTMADGIGGDHVNDCAESVAESDFKNHSSLLNISTKLIKRDLHEHHFEFKEIICEEVLKAMNGLNPNKSWGHDRLDSKIMKVGANELVPSLTVIFGRLQDILILMFKVKNKLVMNYISDIFNIKEEDTNGNRFKTFSYGKHSLRFLGPQLWPKLSKEERNIDTLAAFRKMIRKKDVTSIVEGCGTECRLCLA